MKRFSKISRLALESKGDCAGTADFRQVGLTLLVVLLLSAGWFTSRWYYKDSAVTKAEEPSFDGVRIPKNLSSPQIYAVPGMEVCIYFDNLGFVEDPNDIRASVEFSGDFGSLERRRWVGRPTHSDVGEHTLRIDLSVYDPENPKWSEADYRLYEIKVIVEPVERTDREMRLLIVGDSITRQIHWPNTVIGKLRDENGVDVRTIGQVEFSEGGGLGYGRVRNVKDGLEVIEYSDKFTTEWCQFRAKSDPGVRVEAYNGWSTGTFLQRKFSHSPSGNPESDVSRSPFWWPDALTSPEQSSADLLSYKWDDNGDPLDSGQLSFKRYLEFQAEGTPPDAVIMMLGTNDGYFSPALQSDHTSKDAANFVKNVESLIALFREGNPDLPVFLISPPPVAVSPSAFHQNYGRYSLSAAKVAKLAIQIHQEAMLKSFVDREAEGIYFIPAFLGMDPVDGYMPSQTVHPSEIGQTQLANQVYAYMVHWMRGGKGL